MIDYRIYFDEENNLCLKGRAFYFFYVLIIMLFLCIGLPFAVHCDKTIVISGTAFFLLFVLFALGLSTSIRIIFFKPIQRSIKIARSGTITVRDAMIIGRHSFEMELDEIVDIAFVYYRTTGIFQNYRILVRFKDGTDRFLVEENILLLERQARKARQELCALLKELHRDSAISVQECSSDMY